MSESLAAANLRQVTLPINVEACNKVIDDLSWGAVRSEAAGSQVFPMTTDVLDMGKLRIDTLLHVNTAPILVAMPRKRGAYGREERDTIRDEPAVIGLTDDRDNPFIKVDMSEIADSSTVYVDVSISFDRRNRSRYGEGEICALSNHGIAWANYTGLGKIGSRTFTHLAENRLALHRMGNYYNNTEEFSMPLYRSLLVSDSLSADTHGGGMIARAGSALDHRFTDTLLDADNTVAIPYDMASRVMSACRTAHEWRFLTTKPGALAHMRPGYYAPNYDRVSKRYFERLTRTDDESADYIEKAFNSLARRPVTQIRVHVVFFLITPASGPIKKAKLPDDTKMIMMVDSSPMSQMVVSALQSRLNDYWERIVVSLKPMPVTELVPSKLFTSIEDREDKFEIMSSPFITALVRSVYSGWCYEDPAKADEMFLANPPVSLRGVESVGPATVRTFEGAKARLKAVLGGK